MELLPRADCRPLLQCSSETALLEILRKQAQANYLFFYRLRI